MVRTITVAAVLSLTMSIVPAYAADNDAQTFPSAAAAPVLVAADQAVRAENTTWGSGKVTRSLSRPKALSALYISYAALQAFDVYSTRQALARGAREANPLMQGVVGNTGAFVAVKAGVGVATIMAAERLWKTNKAAAIAVMVASTGVSGLVAARNARTLRQLP